MTRPLSLLLTAAALTATATSQDLRRALQDADFVAVARQVGKRDHDESVVLHQLQVLHGVRGVPAGAAAVTVLDWPQLSLHNRPTPRQSRLYCLADASKTAAALGLPAAGGPYYRMLGFAGSNPLVGAELAADPSVRLARALASSETGADPVATAAALAELALHDAPAVRTEAAQLLAERADLRARLSPVHWSQVLSRLAGETADVDYKIALAELAAEQRLTGVVEALIVGLGPVRDPRYARAAGRLSAHLEGEAATTSILLRTRHARDPQERAALLLALGATRTDSALTALLNLDTVGKDPAVDAALREHRSAAAEQALRDRERPK